MTLSAAQEEQIYADLVGQTRGERQRQQLKALLTPSGALLGPGQFQGTGVKQEWMGRDYTQMRNLVLRVMTQGYEVKDYLQQGRTAYVITGERLEPWKVWVSAHVPDPRVYVKAIEALEGRGVPELVVMDLAYTLIKDAMRRYNTKDTERVWWFDPVMLNTAEDILNANTKDTPEAQRDVKVRGRSKGGVAVQH